MSRTSTNLLEVLTSKWGSAGARAMTLREKEGQSKASYSSCSAFKTEFSSYDGTAKLITNIRHKWNIAKCKP